MNLSRDAKTLLQSLFLMLAITNASAANFALHTGINAFFRTTQTSVEISGADLSFTVELWFKPTGPGTLLNEVDSYEIQYWDKSLAEITADKKIVVSLPGLTGVAEVGSIEFGAWNHFALRYNGATGLLEAFVNGQKSPNTLLGTRQPPIANNDPQLPRPAFFTFGRSTALAVEGWLLADFDEVRIWNFPRSDSQIQTERLLKSVSDETGLQSYWHLDEGGGSDAVDAGPGGHTGLLGGATWIPSNLALDGTPIIGTPSATWQNDGTATLNTSIDAAGLETSIFFQYGLTTNYDSVTATTNLPAAFGSVPVSFFLTNLTQNIYHYRVIASNSVGAAISADATFAITNLSAFAYTFTATNYARTWKLTRPFFTNNAISVELWFNAEGPGVLVNEIDSAVESLWDYSFLEILADRSLVAGLPNVPKVTVATIDYGKWYQVAFRYNPVTGIMDIFLDGVITATSTGTRSVPWDSGRSVVLAFGRGGANNLGGGAFFSGKMDEVRIWRSVLSDEDILFGASHLLNGARGDLFSYWSFDTVSSDDFSPDKSPNSNPALLVRGSTFAISGIDLDLDLRPIATTGNFTDSISTSVTINGTAFSLDTNAVAFFLWGISELTNQTPAIPVRGGLNTPIQAVISGLEGGVTYSYRLVTSNAVATATGSTATFLKIGWAGYALNLPAGSYLRSFNDQHNYFTNETLTAEIWVKPQKAGVVMSETDRVNTTILDTSLIEILSNGEVVAGVSNVLAITLGTVVFGEWNNIILRYNKATLTLDGFVNGIKSSMSSAGDRTIGWENGRTIIYTFGKSTRTKLGTGESLPGEWDEIRLWNSARTDAEIAATYDQKLTGTNANLKAYYRFDDRLTSVTDSSGSNNRGQIVSASQFVSSGAPIEFNLQQIRISQDGTITLQDFGGVGTAYRVEATADFTDWTVGPTVSTDTLGITTFTVGKTHDAPKRFYRFRRVLP